MYCVSYYTANFFAQFSNCSVWKSHVIFDNVGNFSSNVKVSCDNAASLKTVGKAANMLQVLRVLNIDVV